MKESQSNENISYEPPQLEEFSYGSIRLVSGASGCDMRYSHSTDCNASLSN